MLSRCCCSFLVQETFLALLLQSTQLCNEYLASAGEGKWGTHMRNMCALPARRLTMCAPPSAICQAPMNTTMRAPWGKTYKQYLHFEQNLQCLTLSSLISSLIMSSTYMNTICALSARTLTIWALLPAIYSKPSWTLLCVYFEQRLTICTLLSTSHTAYTVTDGLWFSRLSLLTNLIILLCKYSYVIQETWLPEKTLYM